MASASPVTELNLLGEVIGKFAGKLNVFTSVIEAGVEFVKKGAEITGKTADLADSVARAQRKVASVSSSPDDAQTTFQKVFEQAQRIGAPIEDAANLFVKMSRSARDLHLPQDQILQLTENVQKLSLASGETVKGTTSNVEEFAKILASGKLNADKLREALTNIPGLANVLRDNSSGSTDELTKLAATSKLTGDDLAKSVLARTSRIDDEYLRLSKTREQYDNATLNLAKLGAAKSSVGDVYKVGSDLVERGASAALLPSSLQDRLQQAYRKIEEIEGRNNARRELPGDSAFHLSDNTAYQRELLQAQIALAKVEEERDRENLARRAREAEARQAKFKQIHDEQQAAERGAQTARQQSDAASKSADIQEKATREAVRRTETQETSLGITEKQNSEYEKSHKIASALLSGEQDRAVLLDRCIAVLQQYAQLCSGVTVEQKVQQDCLAAQSKLTDEVCRKTEDATAAQKKCTDELARSIDLTADGTKSRADADKLAEDTRKKTDKSAPETKAGGEADKASDDIRKKADELSRGIAEAIYDGGWKGSKRFWEKFQEWGRATIKNFTIDMVLKPVFQPMMTSIVGAMPPLFGIATAGGIGAGIGANAAAGPGGASALFGSNGFTGIGDLGKMLPGSWGQSVQGWLGTPLFTKPFTTMNAGNMSASAAEHLQKAAGSTGAFSIGDAFGAAGYGVNSFMNFRSGNTLGGIGSLAAAAMMFTPAAPFAPLVALGSQLLGGAFADEKHPVGNAFFAGVAGNHLDPNGPTTSLDGGDTQAAIKMRANTAKLVNQMVDSFSLNIDKNFFSPSITNPRLGGFGNTSNIDLAKSPEEWIKLAFTHNPRSVAVDTSAFSFEREKGYTQSSTYDRDTGTVTTYRDKEGKELTKELWDKAYDDWVKEKQAAAAGDGPSTLFKSDDANVQKVLDRMAGGQFKVGEVEDITKALEYATKFNDNARLAAAGLDTLARQTVEFEIAARDSAKSFKTNALQYIEDAKKYFGDDSPLVEDARKTQRNAALSAIGLIPGNVRMIPGFDDVTLLPGSATSPEKPLTGFAAQIAQATANIEAMKPALEALGYTSKQAATLIENGIAATVQRLGEKVRENFMLANLGLQPGGTDDVARYQFNEQQKQQATDWKAAGISQQDIDALQQKQREVFERGITETHTQRNEGQRGRELAAQMAMGQATSDDLAIQQQTAAQRRELAQAEREGWTQAEIEGLKYVQSLEKQAAAQQRLEQHTRIGEDQRGRELAAKMMMGQATSEELAIQQQAAAQRRELAQAERDGWTQAEIEGLKYVQSLEKQAAAQQRAEQQTRVAEGQRSRELQAQLALRRPGVSQDMIEQYELETKQRQELADATSSGYTAAQFAGLKYVQGLERQALALQQAERALQKEEAYIARTAQAMVGLLAGSSAQQQGQYLVEDIQRQISKAQELRNATSDADRARILEIQHIEDASVAVQRAAAAQQQYNEALKTAKGQIEGFRSSVKQWLDQQQVNQVGGPTAMASYLAAQQQYNEQLDKVRSGDTTAMGSITGYADRLIAAMQALDQPNAVANLTASKDAFDALVNRARAGDADAMSQVLAQADQYRQIGLNAYGSTENYQTLLAEIQQTMKNLPDEISPEDMARKAIEKLNEDLVPPTKEQLDVIKSLERLSTATKTAIGLSNGTLDSTRGAITLLQQSQITEAKTGNILADLILQELRKTPTPTTPTTPIPTGPTPAQQAYYNLVSLAGQVQSIGASWRASGMSEVDIANAIEAQYGTLRDSLLRQMTPDLINDFGRAFWAGAHGPGVDLARDLIRLMGGVPQFAFGGVAMSLGGAGGAFPALLHHGERVLTNEQNAIFERLSDAILETPRWSMPTASQRPANDHVVTREMLAEMREQKQQGEQVVALLAELVTKLAGGDADESTLDDVVDAINRLQPALRGGQALAGARPISKAG